MNKLIDSLHRSKWKSLNKSQIKEVIASLPEIIVSMLDETGEVKWRGIGTFKTKFVPVKVVKSNLTNKQEIIKEHMKVVFYPSKVLETTLKLRKNTRRR